MDFIGIIAEYDPFHNGHAAQLAWLRAKGARCIAVCLSAGATQRGSLPAWSDAVRTRAALQGGADLVVALPAPYACQSAEGFAAAGVALLTALGCDTLAFGAETPHTARLRQTAQTLLSEALVPLLKQNLAAGMPFAAARAAAAETLQPGAGALLHNPNDILGVEYCKAIHRQGSPLMPLALPRLGVQHGSRQPGHWQGREMASASLLRSLAARQGLQALRPYVPAAIYDLYAQEAGQRLVEEKLSLAVLARLRGQTAEDFAGVRGMAEGLDHRLAGALRTAATLPELLRTMATKRYPTARLRRLALDAALGMPAQLPPPPYIHVLGARKAALPRLQKAALPAGASLADLEKTGPAAQKIARLHSRAVDLGALCRVQPGPAGLAYTQKPIFL